MNTTLNEHCIDVCNSLLRGELSAVETYNQAIEKHAGTPEATELARVRDEHARSVAKLRANVSEMGGIPSTDSGAWGIFAKAVQGTANLFGEDSALAALKQGEEHGRKEYHEALADDEVMTECKELFRSDLLMRIEEHIATLSRLEAANG
ncbi:DUF2383 domain-containing protein [Luteolibacter marinus]|uniref:DUF2383 domain-containing protein n=1 Tax=Luteolibacter marinus TaxID=2776705 RepID=UPI0018663BFF|nr:DUF2383 domain-containing protein [Luteolibacter marinus]